MDTLEKKKNSLTKSNDVEKYFNICSDRGTFFIKYVKSKCETIKFSEIGMRKNTWQ